MTVDLDHLLPTEVLQQILGGCDVVTLCNCRAVNRRWRSLVLQLQGAQHSQIRDIFLSTF